MSGRILHVTDLHVGAGDAGREEVEDAVRLLAAEVSPELVVCTGDLTHRNRRVQHERAAVFLRSLDLPLLVLPGNHDIPALPPARLSTPFAEFHRHWPDRDPVYVSPTLAVCGLNSVRPLKYQRGAIDVDQVEHAAGVLRRAGDGALRVVALHHHLASPPWRTGKRSIPRRTRVLQGLAAAGAEVVLGGHTHQGTTVSSAEFVGGRREAGPVVLAAAPGLGRPRPGRHAEASGLNVVEPDGAFVRVRSYAWNGHGFDAVADRRFPRPARPR